MWNDGSAVNYVNWADDEPNGRLDGSDCITMYAGNKGLGEWSDTNCFELNAYACQKQASESARYIVMIIVKTSHLNSRVARGRIYPPPPPPIKLLTF